jgi:hypothetical protein
VYITAAYDHDHDRDVEITVTDARGRLGKLLDTMSMTVGWCT